MSNNKYKVLIIEDEQNINNLLDTLMQANGYQTIIATSCGSGLMMYASHRPDIVILDLGLPDKDGISFLTEIRKTDFTPVIVLSARSDEKDKVEALNLGANDYVTKPFSMKVLLRKIDIILRRTVSNKHLIFKDEYLQIDLDNAHVTVKGQECAVTPTEYRLLRQFLLNRGQLLTYNLLLERLWDSGGQFVDKHALAVNVNRLRGKIEDEEHRYISNVYGMGYQWIG